MDCNCVKNDTTFAHVFEALAGAFDNVGYEIDDIRFCPGCGKSVEVGIGPYDGDGIHLHTSPTGYFFVRVGGGR